MMRYKILHNKINYLVVDNSTIAANKTGNIITSKVTNMSELFRDETTFNGSNVTNWDTSNVTTMY